MDKKTRDMTRMVTDEAKQWLGVIEWARRNPTKDATIYAIDADERDRIRARILEANGGGTMPLNVIITVKPDGHNAPVVVRTQ